MAQKSQIIRALALGLVFGMVPVTAFAQNDPTYSGGPATTSGGPPPGQTVGGSAPAPGTPDVTPGTTMLNPPPAGSPNAIPSPSSVLPSAGLGSAAANQPLQATVGAVELAIGNAPVEVGNCIGVKIHIQNNTNSPLLLDGDRASLEKGGNTMACVTNSTVELNADPPQTIGQIAKNGLAGAVTIGAALAIHDQMIQNGPILGRFRGDERRREAAAERFGKRIVWTGDSTEGVIFFPTTNVGDINGGNVKVPVCTFPTLDVRGYVTTNAGTLQVPTVETVPPLNNRPVKDKKDTAPFNQNLPSTPPQPPLQPLPRLSAP